MSDSSPSKAIKASKGVPADPTSDEESDVDETFITFVSGYDAQPQPDGTIFHAPKYRRVTVKAYKEAGLG